METKKNEGRGKGSGPLIHSVCRCKTLANQNMALEVIGKTPTPHSKDIN